MKGSRYDALFDADSHELERRRRAVDQATTDLARCQQDLRHAQVAYGNRQAAWHNANSPNIPKEEIATAKAHYDKCLAVCHRHEARLEQIRGRIRQLTHAKSWRELGQRFDLTWYAVSMIAGLICFIPVVAAAFFLFDNFLGIMASGTVGFIISFGVLTYLQLRFNVDELNRLLAQSENAQKYESTEAFVAASTFDSAKAAYDPIARLYRIQTAYGDAATSLLTCQNNVVTATTILARATQDYQQFKESHSRRNRLLATDWQSLKGVPFEEFLYEVFKELGFFVETTRAVGDHGVDLILTKGTFKIAVQAKGYPNTSVGNKAVQEAYSGMAIYGCSHCAVVTNSVFTRAAREAAGHLKCLLVEQAEMEAL